MERTFTLSEFVALCNQCDYVSELRNGDIASKTLGYNLLDLAECKEKPRYIIEDDNRAFFNSLKSRGLKTEYIFLQDSSIIANTNLFEPFYTVGRCEILNQKWHTLISWLAFLDTKHFDLEKNVCEPSAYWNIEKIVFDDEKMKTRIFYSSGTASKWYSSKGLNEWISHAVK